jgi:hypothetical protein
MAGLVSRTGAWYIVSEDKKVQGREAFINYVKENEQFRKDIEDKLNGTI